MHCLPGKPDGGCSPDASEGMEQEARAPVRAREGVGARRRPVGGSRRGDRSAHRQQATRAVGRGEELERELEVERLEVEEQWVEVEVVGLEVEEQLVEIEVVRVEVEEQRVALEVVRIEGEGHVVAVEGRRVEVEVVGLEEQRVQVKVDRVEV